MMFLPLAPPSEDIHKEDADGTRNDIELGTGKVLNVGF